MILQLIVNVPPSDCMANDPTTTQVRKSKTATIVTSANWPTKKGLHILSVHILKATTLELKRKGLRER